MQFASCKGDSNTTKGPNARKGRTPDRSGAARMPLDTARIVRKPVGIGEPPCGGSQNDTTVNSPRRCGYCGGDPPWLMQLDVPSPDSAAAGTLAVSFKFTQTPTHTCSNSHSKPARWGIGASKFRTYPQNRGYQLEEKAINWHLRCRFLDLSRPRVSIGEFFRESSLLRVCH